MERKIIKNFYNKDNIGPFRKVNLLEALIVGILIFLIITPIPFVPKIKTITYITYEIIYVPLFIHGIKERSIGLFFYEEIKNRTTRKSNVFHYAPPSTDLQTAKWKSINSDESIIEQNFKKVKKKIDEFRG